ncbi:hypothetical protein QYE76_049058 [Lolium multiflorum]|uniref:Transposase (putative) gypsy type domain-containing protein n=1 Tax=Lolium multiflorum TaxID=4521 RepID=A0AAD8SNK8_LOLMU|nr:hypothetical protein QYE76_049058 [Lolium multiflorum]
MAAADLGSAEWERSKITSQDINLLKKLGISKKPDALRFPSEESYPTPPMEYRVSFVDHLIRGLSAPIHNFLRGLLFMYGLQLHHLTPNSILHISIFITLCESFLGVQPNWALWKRLFFCRHNGSTNVAYNIGGVAISVRPDVDYFDVKFPDSVQGWRKKWLYIHEENHGSVEDNIPPFDGAEKIYRHRSWDAKATAEENTATEALMTRIRELQNTRGQELSCIQITAYFLRIRVQPLQARKNPLWKYAGDEDVDRLTVDLSVKDLEKLVREISSLSKKDPVPSSCRVKPYSATNPLPENHRNLVYLPPLPEGGEVEERAVVTDDNQGTSRPESETAVSRKSAASSEKETQSEGTTSVPSPPPAVSPRRKRRRTEVEDSGTSKAEEADPSKGKKAFDPFVDALVSSDNEEENPTIVVAARTSMSRTLVVSDAQPEVEETSPPQHDVEHPTPPASPRAPSPKRARIEPVEESTPLSGGFTTASLNDPLMKEFFRLGTQFVGYRDLSDRLKANLAEATNRADALARKLEQSEKARKEAEADAKKAKAEAATVEDLRKRLHEAENSLSEHISQQSAREEAVIKRLASQSRRFVRKTGQEYGLSDPDNDPLFDALSLLEIHGDEARDGLAEAEAGLSQLYPYFFPKKEQPAPFLALAKCFNTSENLGLKLRQESLKVGVESTIALVAESQQSVDCTRVGDKQEMETKRWQSLIKAAKPNSKKLIFDNYTPTPTPPDVLPPSSRSRKVPVDAELGEGSLSMNLSQELEELRQQLQYAKKQTLVIMEQSRKASEAEKIALQQVQEAMAAKGIAVSEAEKATTRENFMLELMNEASADMSGSFLDAAAEEERVNTRKNLLVNLSLDHGSLFWATPERTRQIVRFQDRASQICDFLDFCTRTLSLVYKTMFPRNEAPDTLLGLMEKFRDAPRIHGFVRAQLSAGARFAMMMIKICHPKFDMSQIVPKCLAKMAKKKRDVGKIDDHVTPVAEDMMDELLRMDSEFFVKGSYAEHSTRPANRMTIDNIPGHN